MNVLKGKKTYLLATIATLLTVAQAQGFLKIDPDTLNAILVLLGAGGAASLRAALPKG